MGLWLSVNLDPVQQKRAGRGVDILILIIMNKIPRNGTGLLYRLISCVRFWVLFT